MIREIYYKWIIVLDLKHADWNEEYAKWNKEYVVLEHTGSIWFQAQPMI